MNTINLLNIQFECRYKETRNGFYHEATLLINGEEITKRRVSYLNRTWERWTYESACKSCADKALKHKLITKEMYNQIYELLKQKQ